MHIHLRNVRAKFNWKVMPRLILGDQKHVVGQLQPHGRPDFGCRVSTIYIYMYVRGLRGTEISHTETLEIY